MADFFDFLDTLGDKAVSIYSGQQQAAAQLAAAQIQASANYAAAAQQAQANAAKTAAQTTAKSEQTKMIIFVGAGLLVMALFLRQTRSA